MSSEEISILEKSSEKNHPILSPKTSSTFQIIEEKEKDQRKAIDKLKINKKNIDIQFESYKKINSELIHPESKGILGLSIGNINSKKEKKFVEQLTKNRITSNSAFYFQFNEPKKSKCKVPTLKDYLKINGKIIIGDNKRQLKTSPVLQTLKNNLTDVEILYDDSSYSILLNMQKCVGCTQCANACSTISGQNILECERGGKSHTSSGKLLADTPCISCGQCSLICPMSAITEHFNKEEVSVILKNKQGKIVVCQFAPAV